MTKARLDKIATIEDLAQVVRRRIPKITLGYLESTGYGAMMKDLANAGATVLDQPVVVVGNAFTSRFIYDIPQFVERLSLNLYERQTKRRYQWSS